MDTSTLNAAGVCILCGNPKLAMEECSHCAPALPAVGILADAHKVITGPRQEDYGTPSESFNRIATFWSAYLGITVTPHDVINLMILLKVSRARNGFHRDSYLDIIGYAALSEEF